jgi:pimeloyl-ACP methyl ester carboxylesterase
MIDGLLSRPGNGSFHLYVHDFGANVALHLATRSPHRVRSLIIQNANAHESGMGPKTHRVLVLDNRTHVARFSAP